MTLTPTLINQRIGEFEKDGFTFTIKDDKVNYSPKENVPSALIVFLSEFENLVIDALKQRQILPNPKFDVEGTDIQSKAVWKPSRLSMDGFIDVVTRRIDELMADYRITTHWEFIDELDRSLQFNYEPFWEGVVKIYEILYYKSLFYNEPELPEHFPKEILAVPLKIWLTGGLKPI